MQYLSGLKLALKRQESLGIPESCKEMSAASWGVTPCSAAHCYPSAEGWGASAELEGSKVPTAPLLSFMSDSSAQTPLSTELGMIKSQKQVQLCLYPHLSDHHSLLIPHPEVMWVSAMHWCVMGVPFLGTQCVIAWQWDPMPSKKKTGTRRRLFISQCHS